MNKMASNRRSDGGFTLIELLVAMVVLALLLGVATASLGIARQTSVAASRALDTAADIAMTQDFFHRQLSAVLKLPRELRSERPSFEGRNDALQFVAALPEHLGAQLYIFTVRVDVTEPDRPLVVLAVPLDAPAKEPERFVLVRSVENLSIAYLGPASDDGDPTALVWQDHWPARDMFPRLIRIDIKFAGSVTMQWPTLFIRPLLS